MLKICGYTVDANKKMLGQVRRKLLEKVGS